jgi:pantetheine-phosphate adenylyltransferase
MKSALYAGSFDPFTNGHMYIYNQAKDLFDEVVVLLANNPAKKRLTDISAMAAMIAGATNCQKVFVYDGLVADYCRDHGIDYLVRGLRNTSDYLYEEEVAKANAEIYPKLKTIYFRAKDDAISSTLVRLLHERGKDISKYIPQGIEIK